MKIFEDSRIKKIVALAGIGLQLLFAVLLVFLAVDQDESSLISMFTNSYRFDDIDLVLNGIVCAGVVTSIIVSGISIYYALVAKRMMKLHCVGVMASVITFIFTIINSDVYKPIFAILLFIVSVLLVAYLTVYYMKNKDVEKESEKDTVEEDEDDEIKNPRGGVIPTIVLMFVGLAAAFLIFVLPVCTFGEKALFKLFDAFKATESNTFEFAPEAPDMNLGLICLISFSAFFIYFMWLVLDASKVFTYNRHSVQKFYQKGRRNLYYSFTLAIIYFMFSIVMEYIVFDKLNDKTVSVQNISFIPLLILGVVIIVQSILTSRYIKEDNKRVKARKLNRFITLLFTLGFIGLLVGSLFSKIMNIEYDSAEWGKFGPLVIDGWSVITNAESVAADQFQLLAYLIYVILVLGVVGLVLTLSTFFRGSKYFYKTSLITNIATFIGMVALALFAKYFSIADEINKEAIKTISEAYIPNLDFSYETTVTSDTTLFMFIGLGLFGLLAVFRPYSKQIVDEGLNVNINDLDELGEAIGASGGAGGGGGAGAFSREDVSEEKSKDFDSCPAFSEIDGEESEIKQDIAARREKTFTNPTLPTIVRFIVDYAKESRLHLSYKEEDIAQFIAGLGSSKLSILQGMSGTGKTSLPKIFAEAIMGNVNIVEVESSWKDKNELIGYYNEFSGKFTPKKFTQSLYRSLFYSDVITFIVLDEMNLSRIEYYFSDFLSLMENEPDKREIKLLNVQLKNIKRGENLAYKGLKKGHTLKVSPNIWFIGTANRDESTFEISDKVYDRAMTMNFNKRAPKIDAYSQPIDQRFLDFNVFNELLEKAATNFNFDCSTNPTIKAVEKLLAPYNISFGNRIERQIEKFVSVYCSCFTDSEKMMPVAIEKILFSKVVAKLEFKSVENKEELAHSFEELGLMECASFINKLNGDL